MSFPDREQSLNPEEAALRENAVQLVRDGQVDLALRYTFLAVWPSDFAADTAAAAWDMEGNPEAVEKDLQELAKRGLIQFDQASARYKMNEVMKRVAAGLFGDKSQK